MTGPAGLVALALIWSAVAYRTWTLVRRPRGAAAWIYWRSILALAGAVSLFVPPIYRAFYALTGVPNLAELFGHALILISGWQASAVLLFLAYGDDPATARRMLRVRGLLVLVTLIVATYFFVLIPADRNTTRFTTEYADAPYINHYWITYLFAVNILQADIARLFLKYSGKSTREALRIGLRIVAAGVLVGSSYWVHWIVFLILQNTTGTTPGWLNLWGTVSAVGAVLLVVVGSTVPTLGLRVGLRGPLAMWNERRIWKQMEPLWRAITHEFVDIALPDRATDGAKLSLRLYRRRLEVLDGVLALQPYRDPAAERVARQCYQSRGLKGDDLEAAVEAAVLHNALTARRAGAAPNEAAAAAVGNGDVGREDAAWLARVSMEFDRIRGVQEKEMVR